MAFYVFYAVKPCLESFFFRCTKPCVGLEPEAAHLRCSYQSLRKFPRQLVVRQVEEFKVGEVSDLGGDGARQLVVVQVKEFKVREVSDLGGDGARQVVGEQVELFQIREVSDLRGDGRQVV